MIRVHTEEQSGKADFQIAGNAAISAKIMQLRLRRLLRLTGCGSVRELRQRIASEREQGAIICSGSGKGYWRPKDRQEIEQFIKTMKAMSVEHAKGDQKCKPGS